MSSYSLEPPLRLSTKWWFFCRRFLGICIYVNVMGSIRKRQPKTNMPRKRPLAFANETQKKKTKVVTVACGWSDLPSDVKKEVVKMMDYKTLKSMVRDRMRLI